MATPVVLIGTFNMNQRSIEQDLSDWLSTHPSLSSAADSASPPTSPVSSDPTVDAATPAPGTATPLVPDIVAVAVQEMAPYPDAFIHDTYHLQDKVAALAALILRTLHRTCPGHRFSLISQTVQVGMALFVFTRDGSMTEHIEKTLSASVGTGPGGMGNKGAVAAKLSVRLPSTTPVPHLLDQQPGQEHLFNNNRPFEICIINAHLSAHLNQIKRRNDDYLAISRRMVFVDDSDNQVAAQSDLYQLDNDSRPLLPKKRTTPKSSVSKVYRDSFSTGSSASVSAKQDVYNDTDNSKKRRSKSKKDIQWEETIFSCDYVFWAGDLNYRLDLAQCDGSTSSKKKKKRSFSSLSSSSSSSLSSSSLNEPLLSQTTLPDLTPTEIVQTIQAGHYRRLYSHDQLSAQRKTMNVFRHFHEAPLAFAPTFKFKMGSNEYDVSKRVPAWTDRVLWYVHPRTHSSFDEAKEEELDAWDEHSRGLGVGTLPMESSPYDIVNTDGHQPPYRRRYENLSSTSASTDATMSSGGNNNYFQQTHHYGPGGIGSKSRGTFQSLAKKGSASRAALHASTFQCPDGSHQQVVESPGSTLPPAPPGNHHQQQQQQSLPPPLTTVASSNSLNSLSSRTLMCQSPTGHDQPHTHSHHHHHDHLVSTSPLLIHYYTSHPGYLSSDHKPVSALFTLQPQFLATQLVQGPYGIDAAWRRKKWVGKKLTTVVGHLLRWGFVVLGVGLVLGLTIVVRKYIHRR
ncbi:hypothetical protein BGZ94_001827 [Podila epigama]|nr:hypothetical protein BGZ94_001827 [Podila epigama]